MLELLARPAVAAPALLVVGYILYHLLLRSPKLPDLPIVGAKEGDWFPMLQARWRNIVDFETGLSEGYQKYKGQPVIIPASHRTSVMLPLSEVEWYLNQPDDVLSFHLAAHESLQLDHTTLDRRLAHDTANNRVVTVTLNSQLGNLVPDIFDEVKFGFEKCWGGTPGEAREVNLYESTTRIIAGVTARIILGTSFSRDEDFLKLSTACAQDLPISAQMLMFIWKPLRPVLAPLVTLAAKTRLRRYKRAIAPEVNRRLAAWDARVNDAEAEGGKAGTNGEPNDFLQWTIRHAKESGNPTMWELDILAGRTLMLNFAAIHTSSLTQTAAVLELAASDPSVAAELRAEISAVVAEHGWTKRSLARMEKLDSVFRESARLNSFVTLGMERKVVAPGGNLRVDTANMGSLDQDQVYDFVICGGGTSGCVIAGRLAESPDVSILVIEAGQDSKDLENVHMVGGARQLFDADTDWNVISKPNPGADNRAVKLSRGKFLGGCSGCNATLCVRGSRQDYDDWGVEGWSGNEVFAYMRKAERFHGKDWFKACEPEHGNDGLLDVEPYDLAPISKLLFESFVDKGLPLDDDMFTHGETPHGCGHAIRSAHNGIRSSAAKFISDKARARGGVEIMTETHVDKVVIERVDGELKATGVRVVKADGSVMNVKARKEVIVSGGAYCSPNILNRSGIGAKDELDKFGIETLVDLPGVGKNLMDHLITFIIYETEQEGLTVDKDLFHDDGLAKSYALWKDQKAGVLAGFPFGCVAFARLDERLADSAVWNDAPREPGRDPMGLTPRQPNVEILTIQSYGGPKHFTDFPVGGKHTFCLVPELFSPRSRGTVTLPSVDAKDIPVVDTNYLADPLDVEVMAEACRFANEIVMDGKGTRDVVKGSWPSNLTHHKYTTREDWIPYVKQNATTCYHPAGTCAMGSTEDPKTVVDAALKVKGVEGLRVADCSIMPTLNGGHTQMPAYAIGEKAADLIKEAWGLKSGQKKTLMASQDIQSFGNLELSCVNKL
ncbi:hypothetical protein PspLS_00717 [Pyricularia sp. CBS 133598]|nr:hypothetical protein PspLS_00717 [Pyricularia sp. CBS 133598]